MRDERDLSTLKMASSIILSVVFCTMILLFPAGLQAKGKKSAWVEVRSPHFTVVSNSFNDVAKLVALRLELIRPALQTIFPSAKTSQPSQVRVLAVSDEVTLQRLLHGRVKASGRTHLGGVFVNTEIGPYIIFRTDIIGRDDYVIVLHEYTHYVMRKALPDLPPWLIEGLAGFYGNTIIRKHDILLGVADPNYLSSLNGWSFAPVHTLLQTGCGAPAHKERIDVAAFYAEAWALTDYLLMQDAKNLTHLVPDYVRQVTNGGDPVEAFVKLFGPTKDMDKALRSYVRKKTFPVLKYPITEEVSSKGYKVRPLFRTEADCDQAQFLLLQKHPKDAAKLLKEALADNPRSGPATALMSYLLWQEGKKGQAADLARKAIQLDPNDYRGYFYAAHALQNDHPSPTQAAAYQRDLERALALHPGLPGAQDMLAVAYLTAWKKLELALAYAASAAQADPQNIQYLIDMESILLKQDRQAEAAAVEVGMLHRAHTLNQEAAVRNQIGWDLLQQNVAMGRADFEIKKANQLDPKNANIIDSLGHLLEKEGDLPHAEDAYRHGLALQPKMLSSLRGLGDVLRKEHHLDEAITQYHKALAVAPKDALVHYDLSLALKEKGDGAGAAAELKTAHGLDPFNTEYQ